MSRLTAIASAALAIGTLLMLLGILDDLNRAYRVGLLIWLSGSLALATLRRRSTDAVFDEGVHVGYARGYREGRREGRPVVVPIERETKAS